MKKRNEKKKKVTRAKSKQNNRRPVKKLSRNSNNKKTGSRAGIKRKQGKTGGEGQKKILRSQGRGRVINSTSGNKKPARKLQVRGIERSNHSSKRKNNPERKREVLKLSLRDRKLAKELQRDFDFLFYTDELKLEKENLKTVKDKLKKYIDLPKNRKIKYGGRLRNYWTVINSILNEAKLINNKISQYENTLRIKKIRPFEVTEQQKKLGKAEAPEFYFAWGLHDCQDSITKDVEVQYFHEWNVRKDMDVVIDFLVNVFSNMDSKDVFVLIKNIITLRAYSYVITNNPQKFDDLYRAKKKKK